MQEYLLIVYMIILIIYINAFFSFGRINDKILMALLSIVLVFLVAIRPIDLFSDTDWYKLVFENMDPQKNIGFSLLRHEAKTDIEYGFYYFTKFIKLYITNNYRIYFGIIAAIDIILIVIFSKIKYKNDIVKKKLFLAFLIPYFGMFYMCIAIRSGIAMLLVLCAWQILRKYKNIPVSIILCIFAFSLHRLALIALIPWVIFSFFKGLKRRTYFIIWVIDGILLFLGTPSLNFFLMNIASKLLKHTPLYKMYYGYIDNGFLSNLWTHKMPLVYIFFWICGYIMIRWIKNKEFCDENHKYLNVYISGLTGASLFYFFPGGTRVFDFFFSAMPLILVNIYSDKRRHLYDKGTLFLFGLFYMVISFAIVIRRA